MPKTTYTYSPPNMASLSARPVSSKKGEKFRIYNIFKPTLILDELSLPESTDSDEKVVESAVGLEYPLVKINNYFITPQEIDFLTIDSRDFLPRLTLQVTFVSDLFMDRELPKDGDLVSVFLRNKNDVLNPIRNDYIITGVSATNRRTMGTSPITLTFFGELFVPGLKGFIPKTILGTSMDALKDIARSMGLGFNTNDDDTDDRQIWYAWSCYEDFIKDVTEVAWKDENSFYESWIDVYYNLNFVNVQKQLLSADDEVDEAAIMNTVDTDWAYGTREDQDEMVPTPKVFSNYPGFRLSSFYVTLWRPVNRSSSITFKYGLSMISSFFEHSKKRYDAEKNNYWQLKVTPSYDPKKVGNHILLRGRATYDPSINTEELARANYDHNALYIQDKWMGIQYTVTNPNESPDKWDGNQHRNFLRARAHNTLNLAELEKLNLEIEVQGTNTNVIKGDKVPIVIIGMDPYENLKMDPNAETRVRKNEFYSGYFYVKGFTVSWSKKDSVMSGYSQVFILTRREWPPPFAVDNVPITSEQS